MNIPGFRKLRDNNPRSINKALEKSNDYFLRNRGGSSYLVYAKLLTQTGTNAPTAGSSGQNTLTGDTELTYVAPGTYRITNSDNLFVEGKVFPFYNSILNTSVSIMYVSRENDGSMLIETLFSNDDGTWDYGNGELLNTPIEIRVYP